MSSTEFDAREYKQVQRRDWNDAAEGWRKWWHILEQGFSSLTERLLELAEVSTGSRVLDIATGVGEPAITAAERVGFSGKVVATDIAPGMLELARERASERGADNIEFRELDAEALDFPEGSFDAATCRFGLMFMPDRHGALRAVRRCLRAGGRFAVSVWGPPERVPLIAAAMETVARVLDLPAVAPGAPGLFACSDESDLRASFEAAGFVDVRSESFPTEVRFKSVEESVRYMKDVSAPINNLLAGQPADRREAVWAAIAEANEQFVLPDGSLRRSSEALLCVGARS